MKIKEIQVHYEPSINEESDDMIDHNRLDFRDNYNLLGKTNEELTKKIISLEAQI